MESKAHLYDEYSKEVVFLFKLIYELKPHERRFIIETTPHEHIMS
jgi:hypothetical protein